MLRITQSFFLFLFLFCQNVIFSQKKLVSFGDWTVLYNGKLIGISEFNSKNKAAVDIKILRSTLVLPDSALGSELFYQIISRGRLILFINGKKVYDHTHSEVEGAGFDGSKKYLGNIFRYKSSRRSNSVTAVFKNAYDNEINLAIIPIGIEGYLIAREVDHLENYPSIGGASALLLMGSLFLLLFLFHRSLVYNLYFSLFCLCLSCMIFYIFHLSYNLNFNSGNYRSFQMIIQLSFLLLIELFLMFFVNYFIQGKLSKSCKIISVLNSLFLFLTVVVFLSSQNLAVTSLLQGASIILGLFEVVRQIYRGMRSGKREARAIGTGLLLSISIFIGYLVYEVISSLGAGGRMIVIRQNEYNTASLFYLTSALIFPFFMGVNLASNFARNAKLLTIQIRTIEELSEKNLRQEKERQEILKDQNEKLEALVQKRTHELKEQKELIELKQKEILDSIHYARRIQNSLLTSEKYIFRNISRLFRKS
jgi:hypothetical protein